MAPRQRGSQTDPSTIGGGGQNPSELGGGGALELLKEKNPEAYIEQLEFSEPSPSAPTDLAALWDGMAGSGTVDDPKVVTNDHELRAIDNDLTAYYKLGNNIDASLTGDWNSGSGFTPINEGGFNGFKGQLDGKGKVIKGLQAIDPDGRDEKGLFSNLGSSTTNDTVVENLVLYNFNIVASGDVSGALAGNTVQNEAPDQYRIKVRDVLVLDCTVEGEQVGGITSYITLGTTFRRVGAVGCDIIATDDDGVGGIAGEIDGWTWGSGDQYNYQIYSDFYSYNNTYSVPDGGSGTFGTVAGILSADGDVDTQEEFLTSMSNVFTASGNSASNVFGEIEVSDTLGDQMELVDVYHEESLSLANTLINTDSSTIENTPLTDDELRGESIKSLAPSADFSDTWTTVELNTDLSIFGDGYPVLDGDYNRLQAAAQGLGGPFNGSVKGVTPAGYLVNVADGGQDPSDLGTNAEGAQEHPIRNTYPSNSFVGSAFQGYGGVFSSLSSPEQTAEGGTVCVYEDQDTIDAEGYTQTKLVSIGGSGIEGAPVETYIVDGGESWQTEDIPSPVSDIAFLDSTSSIRRRPFFGEVNGELILGGFEDGDQDRSEILVYNPSDGLWSEHPNTLPANMTSTSYHVGDDWIYVWGENSAFRVNGSTLDTLPSHPNAPLTDGGRCPEVDGEIYIHGSNNDDAFEFWKFDINSETYTQLSDFVGLLSFYNYPDTGVGFGQGIMVEYNGSLLYLDGYQWGDQIGAYYSVEEDEWSEPIDIPDQHYHQKSEILGNKTGALVDGVLYTPNPGGATDGRGLLAFTPDKTPFPPDKTPFQ